MRLPRFHSRIRVQSQVWVVPAGYALVALALGWLMSQIDDWLLGGIANQVAAAVENTRLTAAREAIADAIDTAVRTFAGDAVQYDDLTLIVVKRE